jgi:hypothetical protein
MEDRDEVELAPLDDAAAASRVRLDDAGAALEQVAAAGVDGLTHSQATALAADLRAVLEGYAEEARERGESDEVDLAELREMLADVLFDDDYGEAVIEPRQHGASLESALALADALLARLSA